MYTLKELKKKFINGNVETDEGQLVGEILWYKRLLYTNGKEWKLFTFNESEEFDDEIIGIVTKRIEEEKKGKFNWTEDTGIMQALIDIFILNENIEEKLITEDCTKNWDEFIAEIKKILTLLKRDVAQ